MSDASAPLMSLSLDTAHKGSDPNEPQPVDAEDDNADSRPALGAGLPTPGPPEAKEDAQRGHKPGHAHQRPTPAYVVLLRLQQSRIGAGALRMPLRPEVHAAQQHIQDALIKTVLEGSNNSLFVTGPPGCGKTKAVDLAVRAAVEVSRASEGHAPAAVVRLTGVLHWEEQHALKAVARQLCTELERPFVASASFEENLNFFHDVLRSVSQAKRTVMFVLDDFHLFTKRGRPTTLYNLLDALQAHGVQAAVVGVSADHGAVDAMEKRARSRFSHRKVIVPPPCDVTDGVEVTRVLHLQNSVPAVLQSMLLVDAEAAAAAASPQDAAAAASPPPAADARRQGSQRTGSGDDIAAATAAERARHMDPPCQKRHRSACDHAGAPTCSAGGSRGAGAATPSDDLADWNAAVRAAVADTDVQRTLQQLGCCSCHDLGTVCQDLCCSLLAAARGGGGKGACGPPTAAALLAALQRYVDEESPEERAVAQLSQLQAHLVAAAERVQGRCTLNFEAIFAEYNTVRTGIRLGHEAAWAAFQGLRAQGILVAASAKTEHKTPLKRRPVLLAISGEDIRKGLGRGAGPTLALQDARGGATGGLRVEASTV